MMVAPGIFPMTTGGGAPPTPTPPQTNLQLWLKTPIVGLVDNDELNSTNKWPDSSPAMHTDLQGATAGTNKPHYKTGTTIGSFPTVYFDGTGAFVFIPDGGGFQLPLSQGWTEGTIMVIGKKVEDPAVDTTKVGTWSVNTGANFPPAWPWTDGKIYDQTFTNTRKDAVAVDPTPDMKNPLYYVVRSKANQWDAWLNGTQIMTTGTNTFQGNTTNNPGFNIGVSIAGFSQNNLYAYLSEILIYDVYVTSTDFTDLQAYPPARYGAIF